MASVGVGKPDSSAVERTTLDYLADMLEKTFVCKVQVAQYSHPKCEAQFQV